MNNEILIEVQTIVYMVASVLFILGIKRLGSPRTARVGNVLSMSAMGIAILATLLTPGMDYKWMLLAAVVGSGVGLTLALKVEMTAMPQMVALLNGFGGLASAFVGVGDYWHVTQSVDPGLDYRLTIGLAVAIGTVTFTGSMIAFAKLQELLSGKPFVFPGRTIVSGLLAVALVGAVAWLTTESNPIALAVLLGAGLLLGIFLVLPIGGADMPVVVALLNSYSGMAAAATGFVLNNTLLIVAGALVGTSGLILTQIMCKAMNRSLANVMFGAFGGGSATEEAVEGEMGTMREMSVEDVAVQLGYARQVIFVPGYGMAMAQAQVALRDLADSLEARGVTVKYAIHPVAGRMPGHMNVLLAEANVPYEKLYELEQINGEFPETDVAVVIGANDVVNPDARDNPGSPISGMPILEVDKAQTVVVLKRGRGRGFAGIENPLFFKPNTGMLFGDAKQSLSKLAQAMQEV